MHIVSGMASCGKIRMGRIVVINLVQSKVKFVHNKLMKCQKKYSLFICYS